LVFFFSSLSLVFIFLFFWLWVEKMMMCNEEIFSPFYRNFFY
jgi:hypothetical protein